MDPNGFYDYPEPVGRPQRDLPTRVVELLPLAVQYPIQCTARTLMQIGHEPMPARRYRWLGQEYLGLPSAVGYARFIYNVEGISGLYRGFPAKLVEELIKGYVKDAVFPGIAKGLGASLEPVPPNDQLTSRHYARFVNDLLAEITTSCAATCASFPFYMLNVRMIAQFVGKEDTYPDVLRGAIVLATETGRDDFVEALVPMLIREALLAACWVLARHVVAYFVPVDMDVIMERRSRRLHRTRRQGGRSIRSARAIAAEVDDDGYFQVTNELETEMEIDEWEGSEDSSDMDEAQEDLEEFMVSQQGQAILQGMVHMVPSPYTYPFLHCSTRMCLMNSGLLASSPALMPRYPGWQACLSSLYAGGRSLAYMGSRLLTIRNVPESQAALVMNFQ